MDQAREYELTNKKHVAGLAAERLGHVLGNWIPTESADVRFGELSAACFNRGCDTAAIIRLDGVGAQWTIGGGALHYQCKGRGRLHTVRLPFGR